MKRLIHLFLLSIILMAINISHAGEQCNSERVKLQMLGTGGPELLNTRASSSYLLWLDDKARIIIDAGPGSLQRFKQSKANFNDLSVFLFTHFHVDHSADLSAYIKGGFFTERRSDLFIYGPSGDTFILSAEEFVKRLFSVKHGVYPYLSPFINHDAHSEFKLKTKTIEWTYKDRNIRSIHESEDFSIKTVSVHHGPFPALAYRVDIAGCVISFTGDMSGRLHTMPDLAQNSDILVAHNAITEDATGTPQLLHMKPSYIGKIAGRAKVKHLLLTHMMARSIDRTDETIQLIKKEYSGPITFPNDLDSFHP
ncbi:MAG: MBL fold metallo-hydrolase [Gammaproteobacteria bacterium]|nr:MBL fold metallo-hydrolase [Gammaproteobacteria bacterium]